jgi:PAP2 superfamily
MKCDLHVHSIHSGMRTVPVLKRVCRESYNDPREVYSVRRRKGIAVSRIVVGMHFLADIIAGALMGSLIGCLSVWLFL